MKKPASKVAHNRPKIFFFSVMPTGRNPAQISIPVHKNLPPRDVFIMTFVTEGALSVEQESKVRQLFYVNSKFSHNCSIHPPSHHEI